MKRKLLDGIFYSEFDNIGGSKILYQYPENAVPAEMFDAFSEYIISKPQLCDKLIAFRAEHVNSTTLEKKEVVLMGVPQNIEGKYERNALLFNIVLVFDLTFSPKDGTPIEAMLHKNEKLRMVDVFKPIARKLAFVLRNMEIESQFLIRSQSKQLLKEMIPKILNDLNTQAETCIPIDSSTALCLRIFPKYKDPPTEIGLHQVPFPLIDLKNFVNEEWDLTLQQIIPYIDGLNPVRKIVSKAMVHSDLVKKALQHLIYYECITLVDIFQYSNMYKLIERQKLIQLLEEEAFQKLCLESSIHAPMYHSFVHSIQSKKEKQLNRSFSIDSEMEETNTVTRDLLPQQSLIRQIIHFYTNMKEGIRLKDILDQTLLYMNYRGMILFGLVHGIIKRVYEYPILVESTEESGSEEEEDSEEEEEARPLTQYSATTNATPLFTQQIDIRTLLLQKHLLQNSNTIISSQVEEESSSSLIPHSWLRYLDGKHCTDEICCDLNISYKQFCEKVKSQKNISWALK